MERLHVITQSKEDYDYEESRGWLFLSWLIFSALFTVFFSFFTDSNVLLGGIFVIFLALFMFSDLTKNRKLRSYSQIILGIMFFIFGIIFLISILGFESKEEIIVGLILPIFFFYLSYKRLNKSTNLFKMLFNKRKR